MAKIHDLELDDYLAQSISIDERDLEAEMIKWSATLGYWNHQAAKALQDKLEAQTTLKRVQARLEVRCRLELTQEMQDDIEFDAKGKAKPPKTPTEPMVAARVANHPELHSAQDMVILTEVAWQKMRGITEAVAGKGDMLRSLSRRVIAEMGSDPVIREKWRGERLLRQEENDIELE